jgi:hypothetical protein
MKFFFFCACIIFISCNSHKTKDNQASDYGLSSISLWLLQNEDSLFQDLSERVRIDTFQNKIDGEIVSREYDLKEGIFGTLSQRIHDIGKCIRVFYIFKPARNPYFEILLTSDFDKSCVAAIDSIFADIGALNHFRISKYRPPSGLFSKYINESDTVSADDIAFEFVQRNDKYDVTFYLRIPTTLETKEQLRKDIFGERALLKQIESIKYQRLTDSNGNFLSIEDARLLLHIKE